MSIYLHDIPLSTAQDHLKQSLEAAGLWQVLGSETIKLDENALGRVLAKPIWASISSPHYHASAMDGFAVISENTSGAGPSTPLTFPVEAESAHYVDTGDPLPEWANAVIPIENIESLDENNNITQAIQRPASIRIRAAVAPWSHIRPLGEDIVATQLVLPSGHTLRPVDLGAVAASGHQEINVARKPRVAILPTGTELVPIGSKLKSGDILEYNSLVLAAQIKTMGGEPERYPITKDDFDLICKNVLDAAQDHDLILLNAGSSAGMEDFSSKVVEKLGQLLVHGVAVRPGHPVILGIINREGKQVPIIGVPGYPVSAALTTEIFVEPLMAKWLGRRPLELPTEEAKLTRKITSPAGDADYVRVAAGMVGGNLLVAPLSRGAGVITSLVQADGLVVLPPGVQGMEAGGKVQVRLYRSKSELERTILCIGSHDLILDLMAQFLTESDRRLVSANAGSQGGLIAIKRGEAHMAGSHLLDPENGEYNISYIRRFVPDVPIKLVTLAGREQGLAVRRGNPKAVHGLNDITRADVHFINRQRGSGTRVLLDYHLNQLGISSDLINGYHQEEYTHLGVAAAVASGRATCGLVIAAAAQALDLDFIPLFQERYDLVFPQEYANSQLLAPLFDLLAAPGFRTAVSKLAGYDVSMTGNVVLDDKF
ncbi:MAG: molybdopterin biosynthesis protein [Anaerolineales bacterium]|nr:molybdopterin biosynthesis protein [Anaerolineales bacterium]